MEIKCTYCGASIDASEHNVCPNCGAQLSDNEMYQEYHEEKKKFYDDYKKLMLQDKQTRIEQQKLDMQSQQAEIERQRLENAEKRRTPDHCALASKNNDRKGKSKAALWAIVISILFCAIFVAPIINEISEQNDFGTNATEPYVEPHHDAVAGEVIQTRDYQVILDKWGYYIPTSYAIKDGEKYIKFRFSITNTSSEKIYDDEKIFCYDSNGKACDPQSSISDDDRQSRLNSQWIMPNKSYSGWVYYCIPEDETTLILTYGDSIEIQVDLDENNEIFDISTKPKYYKANFGEIIETSTLSIVLDDWTYYTPEMVLSSGEKFIKFHVVYSNHGTKDFQVSQYAWCYDSNGAEYNSTWMWVPDSEEGERIKDQSIAPGKSYSGWYYFELPENVNDLSIMLFSNVEININLLEDAKE
jgi:hypothetical protein